MPLNTESINTPDEVHTPTLKRAPKRRLSFTESNEQTPLQDAQALTNDSPQSRYFTRSHSPDEKLPNSVLSTYPMEPRQLFMNTKKCTHKVSTEAKTACYVDPDFLEKHGIKLEDLEKKWQKSVKNHRPNCTFGPKSPRSKKPKYAESPGKTKLFSYNNIGVLVVYYYEPHGLPSLPASPIKKKAANTNTLDNVVPLPPNNNQFKEQEFTLTYEGLKATQEEIHHNNGKRTPDQQQTLANDDAPRVSGKAIMDAQGIPTCGAVIHIMHLIAFQYAGNAAQIAGNLVIGTAQANYHTEVIESVPYLLLKHYKKVDIHNKTTLHPEAKDPETNHVGDTIFYTMRTEAFELAFTIDAQEKNFPLNVTCKYLYGVAEVLIEQYNKLTKKQENAPSKGKHVKHLEEEREAAERKPKRARDGKN